MNGEYSILEALFDDEGTEDFDYEGYEDVEMVEVEDGELIEDNNLNPVSGERTHLSDSTMVDVAGNKFNHKLAPTKNNKKKKNKKKKKKKGNPGYINKGNAGHISRFVLDVSRRLREKKTYLVDYAVDCLGVDALNDLVQEVEAIQACGGQKTADESRYRTGGGILWSILKARDPDTYKEIMKKGKEKQCNPQNVMKEAAVNTEGSTCTSIDGAAVIVNTRALECSSQQSSLVQKQLETRKDEGDKRVSVHDRIRIPVSYDDLIVEQQEEDLEKCV